MTIPSSTAHLEMTAAVESASAVVLMILLTTISSSIAAEMASGQKIPPTASLTTIACLTINRPTIFSIRWVATNCFQIRNSSAVIRLATNSNSHLPALTGAIPNSRFNDTNGSRNDIGATFLIIPETHDTIRVPQDYATIQAAIDAASEGDVVMVAPGEYVENLVANAKGFSLISEAGAELTTIRPQDPSLTTLRLSTNLNHVFLLQGFTFTGSDAYVCVEVYRGTADVQIENIFDDNDVDGGA